MEKIFADTDIILDLLAGREPHYEFSAALFSLADKGIIKVYASPLSFSNLNYILSKQYSAEQSRKKLLKLKALIHILPVNEKITELALASEFKDFEDALQYYTAIEGNCKLLLTRNLKDYKKSSLPVLTAEQYIKSRN